MSIFDKIVGVGKSNKVASKAGDALRSGASKASDWAAGIGKGGDMTGKASEALRGGASKVGSWAVNAGKSGNIMGQAEGALRSGAAKAGDWAVGAAGGGKAMSAIGGYAKSAANGLITNAVNQYIPHDLRNAINQGSDILGQFASGDFEGGFVAALDAAMASGKLDSLFGGIPGLGGPSRRKFWGGANALYGGITPTEAMRIHAEVRETKRSKKNLFLLKVRSNLVGDYSHEFNLSCTEIERGLGEVSGNKSRAGGAVLDTLLQREAGTVRITTLDDQKGMLKRWFLDHVAAQVKPDGTFGVPASYAVEILVQHSFVGDTGGFTLKGTYRAQSCETSLSRREDGLEELQMTFTQLDTFMR